MDERRKKLDQQLLEACEDLARVFWLLREKLVDVTQIYPFWIRWANIEKKLTTERRLIEEISLPCRFILEHFSAFMGKLDHTLGYKVGQFQVGRALLSDFYIEEWGNVVLNLGNVQLTWRDEDYRYFFYPDKVMLRSLDRTKPEIHLYFSFVFKYSHLLELYQDLKDHPKVEYWHDDLVIE
ncbi:MAG: hypothetical protein PWQ67_629 [Clostridia bacterium]|nr:hypothetical protein [Clostridia bacterium]